MRSKRERAFEEMRDILDIDVAEIKAKITSLRAQLGREAKKSDQGLGENYKSSWIYFDRLKSQRVVTCCERLHTSANFAQQETTMLRVVASVCTGFNSDLK